jgi:hypothetical protein
MWRKSVPKKEETRPFRPGSCFGVLTVGSLGGELAQRQAALREVMAAGSRVGSCLPTKGRARRVPLRKDFLEIMVDSFWKGLWSAQARLRFSLASYRFEGKSPDRSAHSKVVMETATLVLVGLTVSFVAAHRSNVQT